MTIEISFAEPGVEFLNECTIWYQRFINDVTGCLASGASPRSRAKLITTTLAEYGGILDLSTNTITFETEEQKNWFLSNYA
jgi:hypothetical protein